MESALAALVWVLAAVLAGLGIGVIAAFIVTLVRGQGK
jgi:hypothetical protein